MLTRTWHEDSTDPRGQIVIDPGGLNIVVTLLDMRRGGVKLGIEAPPSMKVMRGEVLVRDKEADDDV